MREGWQEYRLKELCDVITKGTTPTSVGHNFTATGINFIKIESITPDGNFIKKKFATISGECNDKLKRSQLRENDILFSIAGALGRTAMVTKEILPANTNQALSIVRLKNNPSIFSKYILLALSLDLLFDQVEKLRGGVAQQNLSLEQIGNFNITVPSLSEQKRIVEILDEAFAAIDKAKANVEKNLQNAKDLFESYLQNIFANKGEDWEEKPFGELCKLTRGHNPPKSKFLNYPKAGYVRFYQIRDGWADKYAVYVPDTPQLHKVNPDEILMVAYRHIGKAFRGVSGAFNVALCKISNKSRAILSNDYLFYIIPTDIVKGELMKRSERSLIPSMSVEHLKEIIIPLPPLKEQDILVKKLDALKEETKKLETIYQQKLNDLDELKKSILQKAFSGELTSAYIAGEAVLSMAAEPEAVYERNEKVKRRGR